MSTQRFRLPVRAPIRELYIGSLSATIGSLEVIAWATFRLGQPVLWAGIVLIVVGLGYALWCLIRHWRTHWMVRVSQQDLTVTTGRRESKLAWSELGELRTTRRTLSISDRRGIRWKRLGVDPTPRAHAALHNMLDAIESQRRQVTDPPA